jgi:hypothetical protein
VIIIGIMKNKIMEKSQNCKYIKKEGSGCSLNNKCRYPDCIDEYRKGWYNKIEDL